MFSVIRQLGCTVSRRSATIRRTRTCITTIDATLSISAIPSSASSPPIVELREYELHPESVQIYLDATADTAGLRKSLVPIRLFTLPETGGYLNVATHMYHWAGGFNQRSAGRAAMEASEEWKKYLNVVKPCMVRRRSTIFVEAPLVSRIDGVAGLAMGNAEEMLSSLGNKCNDDDVIYEIRRYQLKLGYDTVPKFMELYENGLPSKLEAEGNDPSTALITLLYSEVGSLNEVTEVWRHGGGTIAMERSRVAARKASDWRRAIGDIAGLADTFTSTIHRPTSFSPLR